MKVENIKIALKGHVRVYEIGSGKVLYDDHNALVPNATNIIRRALTNNLSQLDVISAVKANVVLATTNITSVTYGGFGNEVTMKATFSKLSFNDTIDELRLGNNTHGELSVVDSLSIFKDNDTQLGIEWKLNIQI